jgi:ferredoxin
MESPSSELGVGPDADEDEIERAYRERVKEAHPDQGGSVTEFRAVRMAYERLIANDWEDGAEPVEGAEENGERPADGRHAATSEVTFLNYDVLSDYGWRVDDGRLFEKAASADLDPTDYGVFRVEPGESLLEAAENRGFAWPFACRGGACVNCAIVVREGELSMPVNHVLPTEMMERNVRLSCNGMPITDELKVVYNVKHMPALEDLLLPPRPFEQAYPGD